MTLSPEVMLLISPEDRSGRDAGFLPETDAPAARQDGRPPSKRTVAGSSPAGGTSRDYDALEDLFELVFERTGSVRQALRAVLDADAAGRVDAELHAEIGRRGAPRKSCALCSRPPKTAAPVAAPADDIAARRADESPRALAARVAKFHGFTLAQLMGPRRDREICRARFEAYWLLRERNFSGPVIAKALGRTDHVCVFNGLRRFKTMLAADPVLAARVGAQEARAS